MRRGPFRGWMISLSIGLAWYAASAVAFSAPAAGSAIRGRVTAEGRPLSGVLVADGCQVVRTDARGQYELPTGSVSGPFVFVTLPTGYWTEAFYTPLRQAQDAGRADFSVKATPQSARFDFVFITDLHLENRRVGLAKTQASFREINALQPRPAFVWSQGDICLQGQAGPAYQECLALAKMPVRNGPGNHEIMLSHRDPRDDFHKLFGPTYYSFDWGGIHCIVLDGNKAIRGGSEKDYKAVHGAVEGSELRWLEADLAAQPPGKPIVVGIHIPIVSTYPERRRESPKDAPYWEVTNRDVLTELFARHHVRLVLQGHMHENERTWVKGVEYVESISLCGSWFKSGEGFERGVDSVPRGYRIISIDQGKITHRYHSSCDSHVDRQGEFQGLEKPVVAGEAAEIVFNCYDAPNESKAEIRVDQRNWEPMPAYPAFNSSVGLKMPHHFRAVLATTGLAVGQHSVEVRVTSPDGAAVTQRAALGVRDRR